MHPYLLEQLAQQRHQEFQQQAQLRHLRQQAREPLVATLPLREMGMVRKLTLRFANMLIQAGATLKSRLEHQPDPQIGNCK